MNLIKQPSREQRLTAFAEIGQPVEFHFLTKSGKGSAWKRYRVVVTKVTGIPGFPAQFEGQASIIGQGGTVEASGGLMQTEKGEPIGMTAEGDGVKEEWLRSMKKRASQVVITAIYRWQSK